MTITQLFLLFALVVVAQSQNVPQVLANAPVSIGKSRCAQMPVIADFNLQKVI